MELKFDGKVYQFKERISFNDFIEVGIPPKEIMDMNKSKEGFDLSSFKPIFKYLKGLFEATKIDPNLDVGKDIPAAALMGEMTTDPTRILNWIMKGLLGIQDLNK